MTLPGTAAPALEYLHSHAGAAPVRRRVFLVDDHPLVCHWLARIINRQIDLVVSGHAGRSEGCVEAIEQNRADVVILNVSMREGSALDLIAEIKRRLPGVAVVALSLHDSHAAGQALLAGASACVAERNATRDICSTIRSLLRSLPAEFDPSPLSDRELEIFYYLGLARSTREIADSLHISIKTVQVHCGNIREKLGFQGSTELLGVAIRWNAGHSSAPAPAGP